MKPENAEKYPHYFKKLPENMEFIDIYAILHLWDVPHNLGHAIKKLLAPGERGTKDRIKDIKEARDTLNRELELLESFAEKDSIFSLEAGTMKASELTISTQEVKEHGS